MRVRCIVSLDVHVLLGVRPADSDLQGSGGPESAGDDSTWSLAELLTRVIWYHIYLSTYIYLSRSRPQYEYQR